MELLMSHHVLFSYQSINQSINQSRFLAWAQIETIAETINDNYNKE